jgi:hypothetical protein
MAQLNPYYQQVSPTVRPNVSFNPGQRKYVNTNWGGGSGFGSARNDIDLREAVDKFVQWNGNQWDAAGDSPDKYFGKNKTQEELDAEYEAALANWEEKYAPILEEARANGKGTYQTPEQRPQRQLAVDSFNYETYRAHAEKKIETISKELGLNRREAEEFRLRSLANITELEDQWRDAADSYQDQQTIRRYQEQIDSYVGNGAYEEAIAAAREMGEKHGLIPLDGAEGELTVYNIEDRIYTAQDTETLKNLMFNNPALEGMDLSQRLEHIQDNEDAIMEALGYANGYRGIKNKDELNKIALNLYAEEYKQFERDQDQQRQNAEVVYEDLAPKVFDAVTKGEVTSLIDFNTTVIEKMADPRIDTETLQPLLNVLKSALAPDREATPQDYQRLHAVMTPLILEGKDAVTILEAISDPALALPFSVFKEGYNLAGNPSEVAKNYRDEVFNQYRIIAGEDGKNNPMLANAFLQTATRRMTDGSVNLSNSSIDELKSGVKMLMQEATNDFTKRLVSAESDAGYWIDHPDEIPTHAGLVIFNPEERRAVVSSAFDKDFTVTNLNGSGAQSVNPALANMITDGSYDSLKSYDLSRQMTFFDHMGDPCIAIPLKDGAVSQNGEAIYTPVRVYKAIRTEKTRDNNGYRYELMHGMDDKFYAGFDEGQIMFGSIATTGEFLTAENLTGTFGYSLTGEKYETMTQFDLSYVTPDKQNEFFFNQMIEQGSQGGDLMKRKLRENYGAQPIDGSYVPPAPPSPEDLHAEEVNDIESARSALMTYGLDPANSSAMGKIKTGLSIAEEQISSYQTELAKQADIMAQIDKFRESANSATNQIVRGNYLGIIKQKETELLELKSRVDDLKEKQKEARMFMDLYNEKNVNSDEEALERALNSTGTGGRNVQ